MKEVKRKWLKLSLTAKFAWIISIHFFINIITFFPFFLDDFSLANQVIHSIIHLSFFALLFRFVYVPFRVNNAFKKNEKWWFVGFVILNLIPFYQGLEPEDNGFIPIWVIAPQFNIGLPLSYLHWFTTDLQNVQGSVNNPLLHVNILFFNLYFWGVATIAGLGIKKKITARKRSDNIASIPTAHKQDE